MLPLEQGSISSVTEFSAHLLVILCFVHKEFIFPAQSNTIITVCSLHPNSLLCSQHPARKPAAGCRGRCIYCTLLGFWAVEIPFFSQSSHPIRSGRLLLSSCFAGQGGTGLFQQGWMVLCLCHRLFAFLAGPGEPVTFQFSLCPVQNSALLPWPWLKARNTRGATPNPESKDIYLRPRVKHQLITQCFCNLFLDINAWV